MCRFVADSFDWTGHYKLWLSGVHHRDISAFNLMYKRREDSTIVGVLNDFDLATLKGTKSANTERTGTMIFMALDMLSSVIADTHPVHLYRYDAESFLWVAIWVCGTYEDGKERQNASFKDWARGDAKDCRARKRDFLAENDQKLWSKSYQARAGLLRKIRIQLKEDEFDRGLQWDAREDDDEVVQLEEPDCPDTHYNRIDDKLFSTLRKKLEEE